MVFSVYMQKIQWCQVWCCCFIGMQFWWSVLLWASHFRGLMVSRVEIKLFYHSTSILCDFCRIFSVWIELGEQIASLPPLSTKSNEENLWIHGIIKMHNIFEGGSFFTHLIESKGIKMNNWYMDDNAVQGVIVYLNALTKKWVLCGVSY